MITETEIRVMQSQAKEGQQTPEAGRVKGQIIPFACGETQPGDTDLGFGACRNMRE